MCHMCAQDVDFSFVCEKIGKPTCGAAWEGIYTLWYIHTGEDATTVKSEQTQPYMYQQG